MRKKSLLKITPSVLLAIVFFMSSELYLRYIVHYGIQFEVELQHAETYELNITDDIHFIRKSFIDNLHLLHPTQTSRISTPPRPFRITFLGDSVTAGGELTNHLESYPFVVRDLLRHNTKSYENTEIVVVAEGGWNTRIEVAAYDEFITNIPHDLVIVGYCHNDTAEISPTIREKNGKKILSAYRSWLVYLNRIPFNQFITKHSFLIRFFNDILYSKIPWNVKTRRLIFGYCRRPIGHIKSAFQRLAKASEENNIPVMVVIFPSLTEHEPYWDTDMVHILQQWSEEYGFSVLNLRPAYKRYGITSLSAHQNDIAHPNKNGHAIAAKEIVRHLWNSKILTLEDSTLLQSTN